MTTPHDQVALPGFCRGALQVARHQLGDKAGWVGRGFEHKTVLTTLHPLPRHLGCSDCSVNLGSVALQGLLQLQV